ncbi:Pre-rRNA-processing protein TSR2-like protein [Bienertia sinuspersici]
MMETMLMQRENDMIVKSRPYMISEVTMTQFYQGISNVLSNWIALQMAIQNEWGGRDSYQKSQRLVSNIFSWFCQSKAPLCIEELENLLYESMLFSFNTDIEDGSIEEVAEHLMATHEGYLNGYCI